MNRKKLYVIWVIIFLITGCQSNMRDLPEGVSFSRTEIAFAELEWLPDSLQLIGTSPVLPLDGINIGRDPSEVYLWDVETNEYTQVSDETFSLWNEHPVWHPDLELVLYYSNDEFGEDYELGVVDLMGNIITKLEFGDSADWIPNRNEILVNRVALLSLFDVESQLYKTIWLAEKGWSIVDIAVSPDGKEVAILLTDRSLVTQLIIIDLNEGSELKVFESPTRISQIDWDPSGSHLIFLNGSSSNELFAITPDGKCMTDPFSLEYDIEDISWSPNGERIAASTISDIDGVFFLDMSSQLLIDWLDSNSCQ